jgi:hypothetical protein
MHRVGQQADVGGEDVAGTPLCEQYAVADIDSHSIESADLWTATGMTPAVIAGGARVELLTASGHPDVAADLATLGPALTEHCRGRAGPAGAGGAGCST